MRNVADRTRSAIARIEAEAQQQLLNHELSHRMKNMLAMVQSIATQTMRGAADLDTARDVLANRLIALGKSHDLLLGGSLSKAPLASVIESALDIHRDCPDRFVLDGPAVMVGSRAALSLSLMLHELATNAAKYGALSNAEAGHHQLGYRRRRRRRSGHLALDRGRRSGGGRAEARGSAPG